MIWIEMEIIAFELNNLRNVCNVAAIYICNCGKNAIYDCEKNAIYMIEKVFNLTLLLLVAIQGIN